MPENIRPRLFRQSTDTGSRGRERSTSPSLFFRSASASSLLRFRHGRHSVRDGSHLNSERTSGQETEDDDDSQDGIDGTIFDVLPSFQMYNALHRHIPRGNVNADQHDLPPSYQEAHQQSVSCELGVCPGDGNGGSSTTLNSSNSTSYMNLHAISTQHVSLSSTNMADEPIEDDLGDGDYDNINIEKLYSLPKMVTPVEIDIRITKHAVNPDQKPDEESILKEYTSGDIINGYVVIENRSSQPLKFEMFYVTLEGYSTVIDKVNGKRTVKRFLRMVDLSASWSYSSVVSSSGFAYNYGCRDYENCVLGLNNKRVLEPGVKYKKYFMFKFPMRILDVSCKHEQFSHCLVPPSFGIDKFKSNGKYATIRTNPLLGYGHLGTKGSPILTNDLVSETLSINYAVDAKIVGKDTKTGKLNIMRENEYNVRFIPFGFCQPLLGERTPAKQLEALTKLLQDRITALENVFARLDRNERISNHHLQSTDASGTLENDADVDADDIFRCKLRQLYVGNRLDDTYSSLPLRNIKNLTSSDSTVESEFSYTLKIKNRYSKKKIFFPGFSAAKPEQPDSIRSGIIVLSAKIPTDGLPYIQPSLLKKINRLENKNKHDQKNWKALMEPFSDSEVKVLKNLEIKLRCLQSNNSSPHEPPGISSVTTELLCLTTKSVNSIPIKLDAQLLLSKEKIEGIREAYKELLKKIRTLQARFEKDYVALNELYNLSRRQESPRELTFNDFIGPQLIHDVECLANLKVDVRALHHVFKDQMRALKPPDDDLSPVTSGGSAAGNLLNVSFNGSGSSHPPSQQYTLYKSQVIREWVKDKDNEYTRDVNVNLVLNQDIKETLVPSFESCLCSRMYCIRVNIKFEGHVGTASLEIPVRLRMLEA